MKIENKNDFILSVVLCAIYFVIGLVLLFTNFWLMGIILLGCCAYSAITPVKYFIAQRNTAKELQIEVVEEVEVNE